MDVLIGHLAFPHHVPAEPGQANHPSWSPDGARIAYVYLNSVKAVAADKFHPDLQWFRVAKGMAEYRAGHFDVVVLWMNKVRSSDAGAQATLVDLYLAMARHQLKKILFDFLGVDVLRQSQAPGESPHMRIDNNPF